MKKFSIILPVKNGGAYVKECVNSILSQSLDNFNLHVLDNCSTDGTLEWIRALKDERIIIYPSPIPLSIEDNWGRIVTIPKNEFITLIGHDDILHPGYLQVMNDLINANPDASLYQAHFTFIDAAGKTIRKCRPMHASEDVYEFLHSILLNKIDITGTGFLMRSKDYDDVGGIPPSYPNLLFADFELWLNLTAKNYKATAREEIFYFRLHQSTTSVSPDTKYQQAFEKFVFYLKNLKSIDERYKEVIESNADKFILHYCQSLSHRVLRTPASLRIGNSVNGILEKGKKYLSLLSPEKKLKIGTHFPVLAAMVIDSNPLSRYLFLLFRKFHNKPVLK